MTARAKRLTLALAAITLLGGGIYFGSQLSNSSPNDRASGNRPSPSPEEIALIRSIPKPQAPAEAPATDAKKAPPPLNALSQLNDPSKPPRNDVLVLEHLLDQIHTVFQEMPIGEHEEIVAFLKGENPKHIAYIPSDDPNLNAAGKIVDRWGTPYFFHTLSRHRIEVRSAGPDQLHWSEDDVVSETQAPSQT